MTDYLTTLYASVSTTSASTLGDVHTIYCTVQGNQVWFADIDVIMIGS